MNHQEKFEQVIATYFHHVKSNHEKRAILACMQEAARQAFEEGCKAQREKCWAYMKPPPDDHSDMISIQNVMLGTLPENNPENPYHELR